MRPYEQGKQAAMEGKEFWENPHVSGNSMINDGHAWFAGWCCGKQEKDRKGDNPKVSA